VRSGVLALLLLAGCRVAEPPAPDVAAQIEGEAVRYARFESYLQQAVGDPDAVLASDVLTALFDQFLDEELLVRLAREQGFAPQEPKPSEPRPAGRPANRSMARPAIEALLAERAPAPTEAEIAAWYNAHRDELRRPERVLLRQILVEDRRTAEEALRELSAGAEFQQVADRLSRTVGGGVGGLQGELAREDLPPDFADIIFSLREGELSRLVPANYGFHIFQVVRRLPAAVAPLAEVRDEVGDRLRRQQADERLAAMVAEARKRYDVEVYPRNLPFNYEGSYAASQTDHPR
jgi:parvulin-like peptidyl-prolyl isomerase